MNILEKLRKIEIEKIYLWLGIPISLIFLFLMPPFQVPDEPAHYFKALAIAEGQFTCGAPVSAPVNYVSLPDDTVLVKIQKVHEKKVSGTALHKALTNRASADEVSVPTAICTASPIGYIPQAIGLKIGLLTHAPPLVAFYIGRLLALLATTILLYLAIKISPFGKLAFFIISLLPMTVQQISAFSYDALHIGLILLFTAYLLKLTVEPGKISRQDAIQLIVLSLFAFNAKPGFFLFAFLVFLLPRTKFPDVRKYWAYMIGFIVAHISLFLLLRNIFVDLGGAFKNHIDPQAQLMNVLSNPLWFPFQVLQTLYGRPAYYFETTIFKPGWLTSSLPSLWYIFMGVAIVLLLRSVAEKNPLSRNQRLILLGVFLAQFLLVFLALYLAWTPVGNKHVIGIQGRYLLTLLPIFILSFYKSDFHFRSEWIRKNMPIALILFLLTSFVFVFIHIAQLYYKNLSSYF